MDIKGKDYLQVAYRILWFREEHPDWSIETEMLMSSQTSSTFKAIIKDESGRIRATAHSYEDKQGFDSHTEKAETAAIGRALSFVGYGTQFAPDLQDDKKLSDAPIQKTLKHEPPKADPKNIPIRLKEESNPIEKKLQNAVKRMDPDSDGPPPNMFDESIPAHIAGPITKKTSQLDDYVIQFGVKYRNRTFGSIVDRELKGYADYLEKSSEEKGKTLDGAALALVQNIRKYLKEIG